MTKNNRRASVVAIHRKPDRRFGFERRQFSYADFYPERRSGLDRRHGLPSVRHNGLMAERPLGAKCSGCR